MYNLKYIFRDKFFIFLMEYKFKNMGFENGMPFHYGLIV